MGWLNIREAPKRPLGTTATPRTTVLPHATPSPHSSIGTTGASRRWPLGARVHPAASVLPTRRTPRLVAPPRPHSRWDAGSRWWSGLQIGGGCGGRYSARTWRRYRKRRARGAPMPTPSRASPDAPLAMLRPTRPWPPQGRSAYLEHEEVAVIQPTNATAYPVAVVVEVKHAPPTGGAVPGEPRLSQVALPAIADARACVGRGEAGTDITACPLVAETADGKVEPGSREQAWHTVCQRHQPKRRDAEDDQVDAAKANGAKDIARRIRVSLKVDGLRIFAAT